MAVFFWMMFALLLVCITANFVVTVSCVHQRVGRKSQYLLFSVAGRVDDVKLAIVRAEGEIGAIERYSSGTDQFRDQFTGIGSDMIANMHEKATQECVGIRRSLGGISPDGRSLTEKSWAMRRRLIRGFCLDVLAVVVALTFVPWSF
ncbi:hypothetical protein J4H86_06680 [Spiractinospora alimapuensis]|uniref:hypothetical protein n=1 Tax=Spiractinospora alimapuensis TaxID=2820884 RepID=UPI001F43A09E|nr:hypothetical protein [Spiractinospora alimapuensis]QVQ53438.1 hypothetical protein J4H86_06680 [Spiractinospora alimapuensis]